MCGIIGFNFESNKVTPFEIAKHRGPDATQVIKKGKFTLGHNRLSIIDLRPEANQPMVSNDGNYIIVFNGEVYNYKKIKEQLSKKYTFQSNSDTEVVLYSYIDKGEKCLDDFIGMFSLAIYSVKEDKLFCARDRLGIKPFHYYYNEGKFIFASEIKVIKSLLDTDLEIDYSVISQYLHYNRVPFNRSIYKRINKLLPGHCMIFEGNEVTVKEYWNAENYISPTINYSEQEVLEQLDYLLDDSIKLRMIADVELGVFLSGGLDSSAIAYYMSRHSSKPINSFTIGFDGKTKYDERNDAQLVANYLGTNHNEIVLKPNIIDTLPKLVFHFDEPYGNSMALLSYELTKQTKKYATVALAGDGGDEIFGGYYRYQAFDYLQNFKHVPHFLIPIIKALAKLLPESSTGDHFYRRVKIFVNSLGKAEEDIYNDWKIYFSENEIMELFPLHKKLEKTVAAVYRAVNHKDVLIKSSITDLKTFLPANLLVCGDRMSMANSFEVRVPLIDHRIVEFMSQIPTHFRIRNGNKKYILKELLKGKIPDGIINKPKWGFTAPMGAWLMKDFDNLSAKYLSKDRIENRGILEYQFIEQIIKEHQHGSRDRSSFIWNLIVLEEWFNQNNIYKH